MSFARADEAADETAVAAFVTASLTGPMTVSSRDDVTWYAWLSIPAVEVEAAPDCGAEEEGEACEDELEEVDVVALAMNVEEAGAVVTLEADALKLCAAAFE